VNLHRQQFHCFHQRFQFLLQPFWQPFQLLHIHRVGIATLKNKIVEDAENRRRLYARFLYSQKFVQDDPWAERAAGADAHEFKRLPELADA